MALRTADAQLGLSVDSARCTILNPEKEGSDVLYKMFRPTDYKGRKWVHRPCRLTNVTTPSCREVWVEFHFATLTK
jgi:hypothetical protein